MDRIPDEIILKIMELACDELEIYESRSQVWGFQSGFTQGRDSEWELGTDVEHDTKVARVLDTYEIHEKRLLRSMTTKKVLRITCKKWAALAASSKLLSRYRSILVKNRAFATNLVETFIESGEGECTAELTIFPDREVPGIQSFYDLLGSLIELTPNLRVLTFSIYPTQGLRLKSTSRLFKAIGNLTSLNHLSLYYTIKSMTDVSHLISRMPNLLSLSIYQGPYPDHVLNHKIELPKLDTLKLWCYSNAMTEYLNIWSVPQLRRIGITFFPEPRLPPIDGSSIRPALPCIFESVSTLDISGWSATSFTIDISEIPNSFPNIVEFAFLLGWHFKGDLSHKKVERIGFYGGGTLFEFKSSSQAPNPPWWLERNRESTVFVSSTIENLNALNKSNFPRMSTVQSLSLDELQYFLSCGGTPALDEIGSKVWLEWRAKTEECDIRVLDCTGNEFGVEPLFDGKEYDFRYANM